MFGSRSDRACFLDGANKLREHRVVALCGYMAHPEALEDFEAGWRAVLVSAGLLGGLHMAEAMTWSGPIWAGKKAQWGDSAEERRSLLLMAFAETIRMSPLRAVGHVADSAQISKKAEDAKFPELVLFEKTLETAIAAVQDEGVITVFSDWQDGFDSECCRMLSKLRVRRPELANRVKMLAFVDDTAYAEIQAADMFAYTACRETLRRRDRPTDPVDPLYAKLIETTNVYPTSTATLIEAEAFQRMLDVHRRR